MRCYKCGKFASKFQLRGGKHRNCKSILTSKKIFLDRIQNLVKNLIVDNVNYKTGYYFDKPIFKFKEDTIERGRYILEEIENTKHLI